VIVKQSLIEEQITFKPLTLTYKAVHSGCSMSHFFQRHTPICLFFQLLSTCLLLSTRTYYQVQHMSVLTTDDLQKLDDTSTYISRDLFSKKPNSYLTLALYEWLPATHLEMSSVWHCTYTCTFKKLLWSTPAELTSKQVCWICYLDIRYDPARHMVMCWTVKFQHTISKRSLLRTQMTPVIWVFLVPKHTLPKISWTFTHNCENAASCKTYATNS